MNIRIIKAKPFEETLFNNKILPRLTGDEPIDRLMLQRWLETHNFKPTVLYDGNTIIRKDKIISEFKRILKCGTLDKMSNYFYEFLHLNCGSIAHYNKYGWIEEYDNSAKRLCDFFRYNEFGIDIVKHQPDWKTDCISIGNTILSMIDEQTSLNAA